MTRFTIWFCPDCGEQITTDPEYDSATGTYARGHYHDPPEGWHTADGPHHTDPWFDAVEVEVVPALPSISTSAADGARDGRIEELKRLLGKLLPFVPSPHPRRPEGQGPSLQEQVFAAVNLTARELPPPDTKEGASP